MAAIQPPEKADSYPEPTMFGKLPATGFFMRHVRNVEMSNVEIATVQPDQRPAFWIEDADGADFFRLRMPRTSGVPGFVLRDVRNFRVFGSLGVKDTMLDDAKDTKV